MSEKNLEPFKQVFSYLVKFIKGLFKLCIKQLIKAAGHLVLWSTGRPHCSHCHWLARPACQVAFCPVAKLDWTPAPWGPECLCPAQSFSRPAVVPAHIAPRRLCDTGEAHPLSLPLSFYVESKWKQKVVHSILVWDLLALAEIIFLV